MNRPGFIALIAVFTLSAVALLIGIGLSIRGIGETQMSLVSEQTARAQLAAHACAERALMELKNALTYAGNETVTLADGTTCRILAVQGSGASNRVVQATSTVSGVTRKVQVNVASVNPTMSISSWADVVDF
jgi:hypothetical protein